MESNVRNHVVAVVIPSRVYETLNIILDLLDNKSILSKFYLEIDFKDEKREEKRGNT